MAENFPRVGSALVILNSKGEVLLGKRAKQPGLGQWVLPGGGVKPFETIEAAAMREAKEELNLNVQITRRIGVYELLNSETHRIIVYSLAKPVPEDQAIISKDDTTDAAFFNPAQLPELNLSPFIANVLRDANLMPLNNSTQIKVKKAPGTEDLPLPSYATQGSAAFDVHAAVTEETIIAPGSRQLIPTGLYFEIPDGFEVQVRPRSGLALKNGITFPNAPGTIDSDYRGELKIIMQNLGSEPFCVKRGDRIAQLVLAPVTRAHFEVVQELAETERGHGGFGSTGK